MDIKIDRDDLIDRLKAARPHAVKIDAAAYEREAERRGVLALRPSP